MKIGEVLAEVEVVKMNGWDALVFCVGMICMAWIVVTAIKKGW